MNQPHVENEASTDVNAPAPLQAPAEGSRQQAVAGPFGLRDIVVGSAVLVMLVGSVLPFTIGSGLNLWTAFSLFYVGIGIIMPLLAAGLFIARRLSPDMKLRIGSLSVDQFASVIAVLAVIFFFLQLVYVFSIGSLIGLIGSVALVSATTFAPHIPPFSEEFKGRTEVPAHPVARDALPLHRAPKPAPAPKPEGPAAGTPAAPAAAGRFGRNPAGAAQAGAGQPGAAPAGPEAREQGQAAFNTGRPAQAGTDQPRTAATGAAGVAAAAGAAGAAGAAAGTAAGATGETGAAPTTGAGARAAETPAAPGAGGPAAASPSDAASQKPAADSRTPAGEDALPATTVNPAVASGTPSSSQPATQAQESISATREENENVVEAFWFAVGTPRQIVDERTGLPLFMFYPGDWELGLEDRGHEFLVQDKRTGRIGVLRDLTNIERVSDDSSGH
ncbi:hypothetical protein H9638_12090 [Arthrobacter sp. Sa2BUA2]|uniref:Uncharacterized protein n=1 Tax=Arthrobacter pullicola TaxID=2762224 RepID=A0ABR8YJY1_9MICC|nr:hypothetical protein [Arthrobacter pullicola]MBD8044548.1 hypothetical protein [Arthrobacter pullicola]